MAARPNGSHAPARPVPRARGQPDQRDAAAAALGALLGIMRWMALAAIVAVLLSLIYLKSSGDPVPIHMVIATIAGRRPLGAGRHRR